jgi:hypothetical protein
MTRRYMDEVEDTRTGRVLRGAQLEYGALIRWDTHILKAWYST